MGFARPACTALVIVLLGGTIQGAAAWQRPTPKPAPKVEACAEMGEGFVRVPCSATCIRVSGSVRVEALQTGAGAALYPGSH